MRGVTATRMSLLRARRRLERVAKGTELLRRQREALVAEVFRHARPAADSRIEITDRARRAWPALLAALARDGEARLRAIGWPLRELPVEVRASQVWGVPVSEIVERPEIHRTPATRGLHPGFAGTAATRSAEEIEAFVGLLLDAAPREMLLRRLGDALGRTSRQVNVLENRVTPGLRSEILAIRRQLEEREREDRFRLGQFLRRRRNAAA